MEKLTGTLIIGKIKDFLGNLYTKVSPYIPSVVDTIKKNWKTILIAIALVFAFLFIKDEYYSIKEHFTSVPQTDITGLTDEKIDARIKTMFPNMNDKEVQYVVEKVHDADSQAPQYIFVTTTQEDADKKAGQIAKDDKADGMTKETTISATGEIQNSYKGIHLEKAHKIKAGATVIDSKVYGSVAYQDKKQELVLHLQPSASNPVKGATYLRTISEW